jgi:hypothetical protein
MRRFKYEKLTDDGLDNGQSDGKSSHGLLVRIAKKFQQIGR